MKRKYNCPKVKVGDFVYFQEDLNRETKYSYKVVRINSKDSIIVEVNKNKKDNFVLGWLDPSIGNGKYWNVISWMKVKIQLMEIE